MNTQYITKLSTHISLISRSKHWVVLLFSDMEYNVCPRQAGLCVCVYVYGGWGGVGAVWGGGGGVVILLRIVVSLGVRFH